MVDVYLSHGGDDEDFVARLTTFLSDAGARVRSTIAPGTAVVVVMTPDAEYSGEVDADIATGAANGVPVVPLLRGGSPLLALAGLAFEEVQDRNHRDRHRDLLPGDRFLARLNSGPSEPVGGWLPAAVRADLRRFVNEDRWLDLIDYATTALGADHPTTLAGRAAALQTSPRPPEESDRALVAAWQRLIADQTSVLGPDHGATMGSRHELAEAEFMSSIPREESIPRMHRLLDDEYRLYGPTHWRTRWTEQTLDFLDR